MKFSEFIEDLGFCVEKGVKGALDQPMSRRDFIKLSTVLAAETIAAGRGVQAIIDRKTIADKISSELETSTQVNDDQTIFNTRVEIINDLGDTSMRHTNAVLLAALGRVLLDS